MWLLFRMFLQAALRCIDNKVNTLLNHQIAVELKGQYTYLYLVSEVFCVSPQLRLTFNTCALHPLHDKSQLLIDTSRRGSGDCNFTGSKCFALCTK